MSIMSDIVVRHKESFFFKLLVFYKGSFYDGGFLPWIFLFVGFERVEDSNLDNLENFKCLRFSH